METLSNILCKVQQSDVIDGVLTIPEHITYVADNLEISELNLVKITAKGVLEIGTHCFSYNNSLIELDFPKLEIVGMCSFCSNKSFTKGYFPNLKKIRKYCFNWNDSFVEGNFPALESVANNCFQYNHSFIRGSFPKLQYVGVDSFSSNDSFTEGEFPQLQIINESSFSSNKSFTQREFPELIRFERRCFTFNPLQKRLKTRYHDFEIKTVSSFLFVVTKQFNEEGVQILRGYNLKRSDYGSTPRKDWGFVVEKNGFCAYGTTKKKALQKLDYNITTNVQEPISSPFFNIALIYNGY